MNEPVCLDVRTKANLNAEDVLGLNFIRTSPAYVFRRHYRQGLRSHILELLHPADVQREKEGIVSDGIKWYPRAKPVRMLRIFRTRFSSHTAAYEELRRVTTIANYLGPDRYARSNEFLVTYRICGTDDILLCGLQEYIEGLNVDPWGYLNAERLADNLIRPRIARRMEGEVDRINLIQTIRASAEAFIDAVKAMIEETGLIPDLAGDGNLILTDEGVIKLVDINNISQIVFDNQIHVDEKRYPVCDKSVEALYELEMHLAGRTSRASDPLYRWFLDPERRREVHYLEREFHRRLNSTAIRAE
jgi:hypothetical protein